jgi:hypothetical protein
VEELEDIAVLVLSCDKYSDIWQAFYDFFFKYWNNCPFKIYHASNHLSFIHPGVIPVYSGIISDWSSETKIILEQIKEKYVLIILDDYFIYKPLDIPTLQASLKILKKLDALFLKLSCFPVSHRSLWEYDILPEAPFMGKIRDWQEYRINLQLGVWNRELLIRLLKPGETPWEFEVNGSIRSNNIPNPCLCIVEDPEKNYVHGPITYLCSALTKGIWMRDALELCKKESIPLATGNREVETRLQYLVRKIYIKTPLSKRKYLDFIRGRILKIPH